MLCLPLLAAIALPSSLEEPRTVAFAGREWLVRRTDERAGPGPNWFNDQPEGVWVDEEGRLHLRVQPSEREWECVEVGLPESLGYGTYRFVVETPPSALADNVVLGLFTNEDDTHEIDLEVSRWGAETGPDTQFVVQPWDAPGNRLRFALPVDPGPYVLAYTWTPESIHFTSECEGFRVEWTYDGPNIPPPGAETARINLWLFQGDPPTPEGVQHVVVSDFRFTPSGR